MLSGWLNSHTRGVSCNATRRKHSSFGTDASNEPNALQTTATICSLTTIHACSFPTRLHLTHNLFMAHELFRRGYL